jgi:hypothetical protein
MYQHPTEQQLAEYRRRSLAPDAFLAVHRHVAECDRCAARCYEPGRDRADVETLLAALVPADEPPYHLTAEAAAGYVAGRLDEIDHESAMSHLEVCAECAATVGRLRASRQSTGRRRARLAPAPGWLAWSRAPSRTLAVTALLIVGLLGVAWLWLRESGSQPAPLSRHAAPAIGDAPTQPAPSPLPPPAPVQIGAGEPPGKSALEVPPQSEAGSAQGASAVLALDDSGQRITLDERGNLGGFERLPERARRLIGSALAAQRIEHPAFLADLNPRRSTMLGAGDDSGEPFRLLGPAGVVVESDRQTFRWQPLAGADSYTVTVTDDALNEVASSGPLRATEWRAPQPLSRGATYSWQVTARLADGRTLTSPVLPAPPAKFRVLDRTQLEELRLARRAYPGSHLALGVLYARAGLSAEAAREFDALARANPRSEVARKLLRSARLNARRR